MAGIAALTAVLLLGLGLVLAALHITPCTILSTV
jgi:hypothetical protein